MSGFQHIEGEYVIVSLGGVYKQVPLYERDGILYANTSGGYVQLREDGSTSHAKVRLVELSWEGALHRTPLGKLCRPDAVPGASSLKGERQKKLLGHSGDNS